MVKQELNAETIFNLKMKHRAQKPLTKEEIENLFWTVESLARSVVAKNGALKEGAEALKRLEKRLDGKDA